MKNRYWNLLRDFSFLLLLMRIHKLLGLLPSFQVEVTSWGVGSGSGVAVAVIVALGSGGLFRGGNGKYVPGVSGLKDVKVEIPEAVAVGSQVTLTCRYDLQNDVLYAVKWYKGKDEFYRFVPKELPPLLVFGNLFAHNIDRTTSDAHQVTITNVTNEMEGKYRCEVTNDIPDFHTLRKVGYMHVVSLPQGSPEVLVEKQRYAIGETVKANCTTPPSNPATNVTWTVNGIPVNSSYHRSIPLGSDNQTRAYAELDFEITQDSFTSGKLKIICHVNIFKLYKREAIATVEEERPRLASVLGTRDSPHTNVGSKHTAEWVLCVVTAANLVLRGLR